MKNVELSYSECIRIIDALEHKREKIEETIKIWLDKANSNIEKKSEYEECAQNWSEQLEEVNQIIEKLIY